MRAVELYATTGPESGLREAELPEPEPSHPLTPGAGVVIEVRAAGVAFPDLLISRGEYQTKAPLPFVPGQEVAGIVRTASPGAGFSPGDRVAAFCVSGGFAELAVAPPHLTFRLPAALDFAEGAGLILNYHTALYALADRGRAQAGETVLVHGAAGGLGSAAVQVARGLGLRTIAVVSGAEKAALARAAGAELVFDSAVEWRERTLAAGGADLVFDPVGGERAAESLRALRRHGRYLVLGFTGRSLTRLKATSLLNRDLDAVGVSWRGSTESDPEPHRRHGAAIAALAEAGFVRPLVGLRLPLSRAADALAVLDRRGGRGKVVLELGEPTG